MNVVRSGSSHDSRFTRYSIVEKTKLEAEQVAPLWWNMTTCPILHALSVAQPGFSGAETGGAQIVSHDSRGAKLHWQGEGNIAGPKSDIFIPAFLI